jgi:exopolysaccharide/PEP-CTERM locus tyrosine autokinase
MKRFLKQKSHEMGGGEPPPSGRRNFSLDFQRLKDMGFVTPLNRRSRIGEEIRLIKRRLMQRMILTERGEMPAERGGSPRGNDHVILVTSARPDEGKSFLALNLALSIAVDEGLNVLLIDADVARPSLRGLLQLEKSDGLTDLLRNPALDLADLLYREDNYPISFLSSGTMVASATDLFASARMRSFMNESAMRYHDRIIIFDAPPLLASTEPVVLAQHVGQVVLAVDAQETSRGALESALDLLERHDNVSLVLNRTTPQMQADQFGTYYESYNADRV